MGWYSAVGRTTMFTLPPETAHRLAGRALSLPLPWAKIGGASTDPSLAVTVAGIPLRNPVGLAAGFDKTGAHVDALGALGFGYVVTGTFTQEAREGNPLPRIARFPRKRSMVNAMGLPNPGAERAATTLGTRGRPAPVFASIADQSREAALSCLEVLSPHVDAIELNASCPNVEWGRDGDDESHLADLVGALVSNTRRPVFVKLPPFLNDVAREGVLALARIAQDSGAAGITCSNTHPVATDRVSVGKGGLSGRALWLHTTKIVAAVVEAIGGALPVHACGGIFGPDDVRECLDAGASTVQIYTSFIYEGPGIVGRLTRGIAGTH
ncbi:MAG: dihydroorotate dehydrogenase [Actinomycetota bacterium]|jgi:dihydroorotate dehydrogenase|nr:dihydroorotate dehydrogenase [Actinomycetota bacterium]